MAEEIKKEHGDIHEIKYQELVSRPVDTARRVASFCNLDVSKTEIERATSRVQDSRALVYRDDPELKSSAKAVECELNLYSYSPQ